MSEAVQKSNGSDKLPAGVTLGPAGRKQYSQKFRDQIARRYLKGESRAAIYEKDHIHGSMVARWVEDYSSRHKRKSKPPKQVKGTKGIPGVNLDPVKIRACIGYLKHAKTDLYTRLSQGDITEFDRAHRLMLDALDVLTS